MRAFWVVGLAAAAALCAACPASAQWRNYDGYQYYPADPVYPAYPRGPAYAPGPADDYGYPDDAPMAPRASRNPAYYQPAYPAGGPGAEGAYGGPDAPADAAALDVQGMSSRQTATIVPNPTHQKPGTIVVDTRSKHLYLVQGDGRAIQYGIGVGRQGFAWKGEAHVQRKAEWPAWYPPSDMIKRRPDLPEHMAGGIENPLGARALYLYKGNKDTLFRIHGTNEPDTIGKAVSSGCIRMMNADVMDLYKRVPVGTRVVVL